MRISSLLIALALLVDLRAKVSEVVIDSQFLHRLVKIYVLEPDVSPGSPMHDAPVLFLLDGGTAFESRSPLEGKCLELEKSISRLVEQGRIPPLFVIAVEEDRRQDRELGRRNEFLSIDDPFFRSSRGELKGGSLQYFFDLELIPAMQARYPISKDRSKCGIGGLSYSAVAAFYLQKDLSARFGLALYESPALEVGNGSLLRDCRNLLAPPIRCFIGMGTREYGSEEPYKDANATLVRGARYLASSLENGVNPVEVKLEIGEDEIHEFVSWRRRYPIGIEFLFAPLK